MNDYLLSLNSVTFSYQSNEVLVDNIDFKAKKGEYIGIVGENGSAKSTLLKLMLGFLKPDSGEIYLKGQNIKDFTQWSSIGYLSQQVRSFNANFPATVEEVVGANLYSQKGLIKLLNKKDKKKIDKVLERVDMLKYKNSLIGKLSGGQQQRVFIARLLISDPEIVFMDEPLVGVDLSSQEIFYDILDDLNKKTGITLIMITHDIKKIFEKADRVILLNDKKIKEYSLTDCKSREERLEIARKNIKNLI